MQLIADQPIEGVMAEETFTTNKDRGAWYVENGYAHADGAKQPDDFGHLATSVPAKQDPTLAENREVPGDPEPHVANATPEPDGNVVGGANEKASAKS